MRAHRGAALVELALITPLIALVASAGLFLCELLHAKLKVQELTRFAAWELTARTLSDFGGGDNDGLFEHERRGVEAEAADRFASLDSSGALSSAMTLAARPPGISVKNERAPFHPGMAPIVVPEGGPWAAAAMAQISLGARTLLDQWRFNSGGLAHARASVAVTPRIAWMPALTLRAELSLLADAWTLHDGADAVIASHRAGNHTTGKDESGLHRQVTRMKFLGDGRFLGAASPLLKSASAVLPIALPDFDGAFVVSRNYGLPGSASCRGIPGYPDGTNGNGADARHGLSDLSDRLDDPKPGCFDSAPLRDTQEYADSLYGQIFARRGNHFMGCQNAQADDPSAAVRSLAGDRFSSTADCERSR